MSCIFCEILAGRAPAATFLETEHVVGFMDIQPVRPGHALIVPRVHEPRASDLPEEAAAALWRAALTVGPAIREALEVDDVHYLVNDGPHAAQTVPHTHLHIVPRCAGDTGRLVARILSKPFGIGFAETEVLTDHALRIQAAVNSVSKN